uniref:Uncharacterized protein n=1 Tax=Glossina pallidipes TaxID=7398 RepID=A0A1A9Z6V0_GLOPL
MNISRSPINVVDSQCQQPVWPAILSRVYSIVSFVAGSILMNCLLGLHITYAHVDCLVTQKKRTAAVLLGKILGSTVVRHTGLRSKFECAPVFLQVGMALDNGKSAAAAALNIAVEARKFREERLGTLTFIFFRKAVDFLG